MNTEAMEATNNDAPKPIVSVLASAMTRMQRSATDSNSHHPRQTSEEQERMQREWQAQSEREARERKEQAHMRRRDSVWKAFVKARGPRYEKCRLANYEVSCDAQRRVVDAVGDYCKNIESRIAEGQNVLLIGPAGTGKDHLQTALCHAAVGACKTLLWVNGTSLWLAIRSTFDGKAERYIPRSFEDSYFDGDLDGNEADIVAKLAAVDVLAISDPVPPSGSLSDFQAATLFTVVDARYSAMRPTFVTMNAATRSEMESKIGVQTVDRLAHGALVLACNWESYRQAKPKE